MSVPLKPLSVDFNSRQLDSKQKKFHTSIERALQHFDSVTEWADYIASLGKLLKALQSWTPQFQNVKFYVPFPYQVSRRLASSLSPNLPSGVHQKTIEVYNVIFSKIGIDALNKECNIWVPGILPLMSYASISVKGPLIDLYENYLLQLSPSTLRLLIKPLVASLFPGIDDDSSEFQPAVFSLLELLRANVADEPLFWQSCFIVMITNKERRLGGLAWLIKMLPSLNAIPHKLAKNKLEVNQGGSKDDTKNRRQTALGLLLPEAKDVVHPEPGLLIRCLVNCLDEENELLIKRGVLDLLLQRINLDSPVIQSLSSSSDLRMLMMSCCKTMLNRDISISRRIWNWLLGPASINATQQHQTSANEYFPHFGEQCLREGLAAMMGDEIQAPVAFRICIAIMDRWEISSRIIPLVFVPLMKTARNFKDNEIIMKNASSFFDSVETNIICSHLFQVAVSELDLDLLSFVLSRFKVGNDEEIVVRHLPLLLMAVLAKRDEFNLSDVYRASALLVSLIPERAFLPIEHAGISQDSRHDNREILKLISEYYLKFLSPANFSNVNESCDFSPPFLSEDLTYHIVAEFHDVLLKISDNGHEFNKMVDLFISLMEKVPNGSNSADDLEPVPAGKGLEQALVDKLFEIKSHLEGNPNESIFGWLKLYTDYIAPKITVIQSAKLTKTFIVGIWPYLIDPNTQIETVKSLDFLQESVRGKHVESALAYAFTSELNISSKISALEGIWVHSGDASTLARRPLELVLDELFDDQDPNFLSTSRWVLGVIKQNLAGRLFHILCENILNCKLIYKDALDDLDDVDSYIYHCQTLINVLKIEPSIVLHTFNLEQTSVQTLEIWEGADVSTYKNLAIAIAIKFLKTKNTTGKSVRTTLLLLDILLDGTEQNFKHIVIFLLHLATKHFSSGDLESELISVSLLDIISKVLALSHNNRITLGIFEDDASHLRYIDFLVLGVTSMDKPLIIHSYVKLLSESLVYFQNSIFSIILPLTTSITGCINKLFHSTSVKGDRYQSIAYLIDGLQELMEVSHSYLSAEESGGYLSAGSSKNDFLQNMVANVFSNDTNASNSKFKHQREIIVQSFKLVVSCCLDIWAWAHDYSKTRESENSELNEGIFEESLHHQAYKYKFQSKKLLSTVFGLEPLEVLEELISEGPGSVSLTLVHALDGNKPALTLPHLFQGIVYRCNKFSSVTFSNTTISKTAPHPLLINQLETPPLLNFILAYLSALESAAVEEIFGDLMLFLKEVTSNHQHYKQLAPLILKVMALVCEKLHNSRFGEDKRVKRELSDAFFRYLPSAMAEDVDINNATLYEELDFVCSRLKYIVIDYPSGDKFSTCVSLFVQFALTPYFRKQNDNYIPKHVTHLALTISKIGSKVKAWKTLVSEAFMSDKKFNLVGQSPLCTEVIFEWSNYPENKEKLMQELITSIGTKANGISPNINPFTSWSDSEIETKCHNILRISFLLLISPRDHHLLCFKFIMGQLEQNLISDDQRMKSHSFLLLRCVLLQFSAMHFGEYWSMLAYSLQTGLQDFYEHLQMQQEFPADVVFQISKSVDLILTLNFEEFSACYEWLFVIDTMNCIYKSDPYISLADEISDYKDFTKSESDDYTMAQDPVVRVPLLQGIHRVEKYTQLRGFFHNLSYAHYEEMYAMKKVDLSSCKSDALADVFAL
ncbi:LAQU0S28e00320g1_1 [Lachancea quebecensis]|uniref:LAQU0S28e00320g1_1 n=1 Tax=Lachancea quebecensis TaxID=1654605 RepID=A0A0P1KXS9_9SACH|nr:LAQU0S28e00320g1_1 [Lachancea quebecensis]